MAFDPGHFLLNKHVMILHNVTQPSASRILNHLRDALGKSTIKAKITLNEYCGYYQISMADVFTKLETYLKK